MIERRRYVRASDAFCAWIDRAATNQSEESMIRVALSALVPAVGMLVALWILVAVTFSGGV